MNKHVPFHSAAVPCGTAPASQAPVGVGATYSPCPNCEGTGFFTAGAFHPDDPRCEATWDCEDCGGTGEDDQEPTWEEFAAPFKRLADGFLRVEL